MKYFVGVILLAAAVVAALLYVPVENGKPLLDAEDVSATLDKSLQAVKQGDAGMDDPGAVLYRWKDSSGNWQYGDTPPAGVAAEPIEKKEVKTVSGDEPVSQGGPDQVENP